MVHDNGCRGAAWASIALLALGAACSGSKPPPSKAAIFDPCTADEECASGLFCASSPEGRHCTLACATTADCPDEYYLECGVLADGTRACLPGCYLSSGLSGFACVDGVPTSCERLGDEHCESCGCDPGLACLTGTGCVPPSDVGGPCDGDEDCLSNNCSTFDGVCRVPLGTPCSASDCDYCLDGWYCSRQCRAEADCQGGRCLGESDGHGQFTGVYYCRPSCHPAASDACHGSECRWHTNAQYYYCDCAFSSCAGTHAPRAIGQPCNNERQCPSPAYCLRTDSGAYCSAACTSSVECGAGIACIAFAPCTPDATCEGVCRPTCGDADPCESGVCIDRLATDGTRIDVCAISDASPGRCDQPGSRIGRCFIFPSCPSKRPARFPLSVAPLFRSTHHAPCARARLYCRALSARLFLVVAGG